MTLATKITVGRIVLIVPTVIFYVLGFLIADLYLPFLITSCVLFALLCCTDFIDGAVARRTNTVSELGKFLDPLADKIVIVVMLFLIVYFKDFSLYTGDVLVLALLSGIVMTRELVISTFRMVAARKGVVLSADIYGKIKTVFLDFGVAFLILAGVHDVMMWVGEILFYIGAVLAIFSGFNYLIKNKQVFNSPDADVKAVTVEDAAVDQTAAIDEEKTNS